VAKSSITINNYDNVLTISVTDQSNTIDHVPAMVYKAVLRDKIILIKDRPSFTLPQLRFGRHKRYFNQITSNYSKEGNSTGVLLYGQKGSGKSLMAEEIGNWMIKQDLPVVMIDAPMSAEEIRIIIRAIGPCMIYIDEFGKVYSDKEDRQRMLTLFSDTSFTGVMFAITGNDSEEFSEYLFCRPQRFRYAISYEGGVDQETLADILKTMSIPESLHAAFKYYARSCRGHLNYDSLLCAIRESAGLTDANELAARLEILNVPKFPVTEWQIENLEFDDASIIDNPGYGYHVTLLDGDLSLTEQRKEEDESVTNLSTTVALNTETLSKTDKHLIRIEGKVTSMTVTLQYGYPTNFVRTVKNIERPMGMGMPSYYQNSPLGRGRNSMITG